MIPDQGTLSETAPAKVLIAIHELSKTGILYFRQNEILKVFYLNRGRISWAISSDEDDKLDHVLLEKKLVQPEILAPYQAGNKIAETFGKVLVENGVLTLESLIQGCREQVRRITASVLRWSSGSFQLVPEPPPTRLVSLDIDVSQVVSQHILGEMDVNIVWEELGAFTGDLQMNADPGKKGLYALDAEQQGVLLRFRQPQRLDAVLLDFPAEGKYRILKILYFFLLSGLLIRKEPEKAAALDFKELDSLFGQSPAEPATEVSIEMPAIIDEAAIQDIPQPGLPEIAIEKRQGAEPAPPLLPDLMPPENVEELSVAPALPDEVEPREVRERPRPQPFRVPEKQKPRWLSISFLSILVTAALIGLFLWLTRSPDMTEPAAGTVVARPHAGQQAKSATAPAGEQETASGQPTAPQGGAPSQAAEADPAQEPPAETAPAAKPEERPAAKEATPAPAEAGSAARQRFAAGDFRGAGAAWREEIIALQVKFSILLEMDCLKDSVLGAYQQVQDKGSFFLLNRTSRDGRSCWLVLWGRFRTAREAELGMSLVPEYFHKQSNPPSVVELAPYL